MGWPPSSSHADYPHSFSPLYSGWPLQASCLQKSPDKQESLGSDDPPKPLEHPSSSLKNYIQPGEEMPLLKGALSLRVSLLETILHFLGNRALMTGLIPESFNISIWGQRIRLRRQHGLAPLGKPKGSVWPALLAAFFSMWRTHLFSALKCIH